MLKKKKAIFLDRDGTVNREVDLLRNIKDLRLIRGAGKAISRLNQAGFTVVVVTNQAVIARGWLAHEGIDMIHKEISRRLKRNKATIDAFYYCPHHPGADLPRYRMMCRCRKPATGLIDDAIEAFDIDTKKSYFIGDTTGDILAGKRANLKTILVQTGYAGKDGKYDAVPDFVAKNLPEAARIILKHDQQ